MKNSSYSVVCLKKDRYYKLQIIIHPDAVIKDIVLDKIITGENRKIANRAICKLLGFWHGYCDKAGAKIKETELILPPLSEYLFMENDLRYFLLKEYDVFLSVSVGVQIDHDGKTAEDDEKDTLKMLIERGFNQN